MANELDKNILEKQQFVQVQDPNELQLFKLEEDKTSQLEAGLNEAIRKQILIETDTTTKYVKLLSTTTVSFAANADTTLYTVPLGQRCAIAYAVVVAGADAGATTTLSIGQDSAETDFIPANTLSNLDVQHDSVRLQPIPNTTPLKNKSYSGGTVIQARVGSQSGGAINTVFLFGFTY